MIQQTGNGFIAVGVLSHDKGRVFVDSQEVDRLIELAHSDHLCETPGGDARPCRFARITLELMEAIEV